MFLIVLTVLLVLFLTYWYLRKMYFTLRGPLPGLAPEFFFGNMRQTGMLTENTSIANVHLELKRQFGDIYRFWMGGAQFVSVCNADDVQHIFQHRHIYDQGDVLVEKFSLLFHNALICNKGAKYKRHASLTLPLFRRGKIMKNFDVIVDCTDRFLLDHWRSSNATDIHTDIVQQSQRLFPAVFGYITFDYDLAGPAAWCIHLLSKNPRVQSKLKAELPNVSFSADHLDSLVDLDAVIREVLRFAPPSNGTVRTLTADDRLPTTGTLLHKGEQVTIPFYNLARDTRYWKVDPEQFFPLRFLENGLDHHHHPFALIPFGGGHRQCIGQELTTFELKATVARLMQCVTFGDGGTDVNSGGHEQQFTILSKRVGATSSFD